MLRPPLPPLPAQWISTPSPSSPEVSTHNHIVSPKGDNNPFSSQWSDSHSHSSQGGSPVRSFEANPFEDSRRTSRPPTAHSIPTNEGPPTPPLNPVTALESLLLMPEPAPDFLTATDGGVIGAGSWSGRSSQTHSPDPTVHFPLDTTHVRRPSTQAAHPDPQTATIPYELLAAATNNFAEKLGSGGEGEVYSGVLQGMDVAVKAVDATATMRASLQNEVDLLSRWGHANIIELHGVSVDGPRMCLVYPRLYCSLFQRLYNPNLATRPLPWAQRMAWAADIVRGIAYLDVVAHCIHGDLKSENVLLDQRSGLAVLTDFGLLRHLTTGADGAAKTVTMTMSIKGTYAYLAPEVISGELSPAQDVFAMGVVLLELLTSKPPLDHARKPKALLDYMIPALRQPDALPAAVDPEAGWPPTLVRALGALVLRSTCQFRTERPTATELLGDLDALFAQHAAPPLYLPEALRCPLTGAPMVDPVVAEDGWAYERAALTQWLRTSTLSPRTGRPLPGPRLLDDHTLQLVLRWARGSGPATRLAWI